MTAPLPHPTCRTLPDERLVALVRAGQDHAFELIVARHGPALTSYARRILAGAHHDAEEAVQDAFVRALDALRAHPDRPIALRAWLYAIVRNACLDRLRRPHRTVAIEPMEAVLHDLGADPLDRVLRRQELRSLVHDLAELPERQRRALVSHELGGRPHERIAEDLDVSVGASKALVCRARAGLAALRDAA